MKRNQVEGGYSGVPQQCHHQTHLATNLGNLAASPSFSTLCGVSRGTETDSMQTLASGDFLSGYI